MKLHIILNNNKLCANFIKQVQDCIEHGIDLNNGEIKTWKKTIFTNRKKQKEVGFINIGTQFEMNGWITFKSGILGIDAIFRKAINIETTDEQKALILFRFATMLRNHFPDQIKSISLLGL